MSDFETVNSILVYFFIAIHINYNVPANEYFKTKHS